MAVLLSLPDTPTKRNRATKLERSKRIRRAQTYLLAGLVRADIVPRLQYLYEVSRSTSNKYVDDALLQMESEKTLHWIENDTDPITLEDNQGLLKMTRQMMIGAHDQYLQTGEPEHASTFTRLSSSYERVYRMGALTSSVSHKN